MPSVTRLQVNQLGPTFAAEVEGIDFSQPIDDALFAELKDTLHKYGVVIIRKTTLDDESMLALGRRFGELDNVTPHRLAGRKFRLDNDEIFDISNIDDKGNIVTKDDPERTSGANGNALWHADGAFNPRRTGVSMLRAVELPPPGSGGETKYIDSKTAYDDLPEEMKEKIEGLVGRNSIFHNRKTANPESPLFKDIDPMQKPLARHKVAQFHPETGRMNLYVTSYLHSFEDMPLEEGQELAKELFAHVTQDKYKFTHHWQDKGDLAIWDNTGVLHRATHGSYEGKHVRDMRRCSAFDTGPTAYGENDPGKVWQQGLA
jgi:alpha-ketoglutarate-dependent 2,4-dichlorophenoxyacetate dioxygenase